MHPFQRPGAGRVPGGRWEVLGKGLVEGLAGQFVSGLRMLALMFVLKCYIYVSAAHFTVTV